MSEIEFEYKVSEKQYKQFHRKQFWTALRWTLLGFAALLLLMLMNMTAASDEPADLFSQLMILINGASIGFLATVAFVAYIVHIRNVNVLWNSIKGSKGYCQFTVKLSPNGFSRISLVTQLENHVKAKIELIDSTHSWHAKYKDVRLLEIIKVGVSDDAAQKIKQLHQSMFCGNQPTNPPTTPPTGPVKPN